MFKYQRAPPEVLVVLHTAVVYELSARETGRGTGLTRAPRSREPRAVSSGSWLLPHHLHYHLCELEPPVAHP